MEQIEKLISFIKTVFSNLNILLIGILIVYITDSTQRNFMNLVSESFPKINFLLVSKWIDYFQLPISFLFFNLVIISLPMLLLKIVYNALYNYYDETSSYNNNPRINNNLFFRHFMTLTKIFIIISMINAILNGKNIISIFITAFKNSVIR